MVGAIDDDAWRQVKDPAVQPPEARACLIALMDRYERPLFKFVYLIAGDADVTSDCVQETFVRAYVNLKKSRPVTTSWLYKVARNLAIDEQRRRRRRAGEEALERVAAPGSGLDIGPAMRQAFARLTPDERTLLYLAAVEGRGAAEIAAILGIKPTAVRMRISRARERFRLAYGGGT